jgi:hypothetical protein
VSGEKEILVYAATFVALQSPKHDMLKLSLTRIGTGVNALLVLQEVTQLSNGL